MTKWNLKVSRDVLQGSRTEHIPVLSGICSAWTLRIHKFWSMFLVSGSSHHTDGPQGRTEVPDWFVNSVRFNGDFSLGISRVLLGVLWSVGLQRVRHKLVTEQQKYSSGTEWVHGQTYILLRKLEGTGLSPWICDCFREMLHQPLCADDSCICWPFLSPL